jgi:hypothetical protein
MISKLLFGIAPEANNTPQIMLLLHMQIRRYFNKICDNKRLLHDPISRSRADNKGNMKKVM